MLTSKVELKVFCKFVRSKDISQYGSVRNRVKNGLLTKDDLKAIVDTISPLIDGRAKTTETLIKGEIKASEERVKEELRSEILAARAEAKANILTLDAKLVKRVPGQG